MLVSACNVSSPQFSIPSAALFKSSSHSKSNASSSLFEGMTDIRSLNPSMISCCVPTKSTFPAVSLWNLADELSHTSFLFPSIASGEFTNKCALSFSINVKSESPAITLNPPPQFPNITEICGITPDASDCFI